MRPSPPLWRFMDTNFQPDEGKEGGVREAGRGEWGTGGMGGRGRTLLPRPQ